MDNSKRKNIRLKSFDYNSTGAYFITICTKGKKHILSDVSVGAIHESPETKLSVYGQIVDRIINYLPERYNLSIDKYVIMPNHIHILVYLDSERAIRKSPLRNRSVISNMVGYLKMNSSKEIHKITPEIELWQRSYYDHIIRDYNDYMAKWNYIDTNPARWAYDEYY